MSQLYLVWHSAHFRVVLCTDLTERGSSTFEQFLSAQGICNKFVPVLGGFQKLLKTNCITALWLVGSPVP